MITKSRACGAIGFTLAVLFSRQVSGGGLSPGVSRSFTDNVSGAGSQQSAVSERSMKRLNSDGAMHGVTLGRTRVYDAQGLQEPKSVLWKTPKLFTIDTEKRWVLFDGPATYYGAPSIITADKEAYLTVRNVNEGDLFFAIDLQTGELKRKFKSQSGGLSAPVVAGDLFFLGTGGGAFHAFDRHDWKTKWQIEGGKGYRHYAISPVVADGIIYFGAAEESIQPNVTPKGSVHAIDALTGTQKWTFKIRGIPTLIAVADEAIYFGDDDRYLFAVSAKEGHELWRFKASADIKTPVIMNGRAFFSDDGGNLYAVDLKNGQAVWKAAKNKVATPLAAYNNLVYYGGRNNSLHAVDALTGQQKWTYRTKKTCLAPAVANGVIYVACKDNALLAVDAESGQEKWKYKTPHPPYSYPVIGNGVIYFLDEEGVIYALSSS
jgi:outer membrane protein assembly factor BamB